MVVTLYDHDIIQPNVQYLTVRLAFLGLSRCFKILYISLVKNICLLMVLCKTHLLSTSL